MKKVKVGLVAGGITDEHYLSIRSAEEIFSQINLDIYDIFYLVWNSDGSWSEYEKNSLTQIKNNYSNMLGCLSAVDHIDIVFMALHGEEEAGGKFAGLLNLMKIPYTGNGFFTSSVGMNKYLSKLIFQKEAIPTPDFIAVNKNSFLKLEERKDYLAEKIKYPCIIKPASSGSSIGVKKIDNFDSLKKELAFLLKNYDQILIEEFIKGNEFNVTVHGSYLNQEKKVFPVTCVEYESEFFDKACKYNNQYQVKSAALSNLFEEKLKELAQKIHNVFMFEGLSRTDFIISGQDIYVLEVNTHPGLAKHSIVPITLRKNGLLFSDLIDDLISWGMERFKRENN